MRLSSSRTAEASSVLGALATAFPVPPRWIRSDLSIGSLTSYIPSSRLWRRQPRAEMSAAPLLWEQPMAIRRRGALSRRPVETRHGAMASREEEAVPVRRSCWAALSVGRTRRCFGDSGFRTFSASALVLNNFVEIAATRTLSATKLQF